MKFLYVYLFLMGFFSTSSSAAITEEWFQKQYNARRITKHVYPRQMIILRDAFVQKVQIWESIHKRNMHPVDLVFPYTKEETTREGNTTFVIEGFSVVERLEENNTRMKEFSKEEKKLVHDIIIAAHMWKYTARFFFARTEPNRYDLLFSFQILLESNRLGNSGLLKSKMTAYHNFGYPYRTTYPKKRMLRRLENKKSSIASPHSYFILLVSYIKRYLKEDEFNKIELLINISKIGVGSPPQDLPLYGLREEPPLEEINPKSLWEKMLGLQEKREVPPCLRDPSVMEGERPFIDMIPPKGFSVFAHAFPEFRDEILGFEAYGMDRGPVIYRGLMDPPPYPVVMITDGEGEDHSSGSAAAASSVSATGPAAAAAASSADVALPAAVDGVGSETVGLLRKRR